MVLPAPATIAARVLAWVLATEGLGEAHLTVAPSALWRPPGGPDPLPGQVAERLTALGWRDRAGDLEREVVATLTVLCRPLVEMYGWITHDGATIGVLAAKIGKDAVLAVRTPDGMVGLSNIPAGRLAERLVAQTPHVVAARGRPFVVSSAEVRAVNRYGRTRTTTGAMVRTASPEARQAKRLLAQDTTGGGELWVAVRDGTGLRQVITQPVRYVDLVGGRRMIAVQGDSRVRLSPADRGQLVAALTEARRTPR